MGNHQSTNFFPQTSLYTIVNKGYTKVWLKKNSNKQVMQQYDILIEDAQILNNYKKMWILRENEPSLVSVYYFTHTSDNYCTNSQKGSLLTQRIPFRLSQFCYIPYQTIVEFILATLHSFSILHQNYGLFFIRSTMIGINTINIIKCWHHTDYSQPLPENANCTNINSMIYSLISSLQTNFQSPTRYPKFSQYLNNQTKQQIITFQNTRQILNKYLHTFNIKAQRFNVSNACLRQMQTWDKETLTLRQNIKSKSGNKYSFHPQSHTRQHENIYMKRQCNQKSSNSSYTSKSKSKFRFVNSGSPSIMPMISPPKQSIKNQKMNVTFKPIQQVNQPSQFQNIYINPFQLKNQLQNNRKNRFMQMSPKIEFKNTKHKSPFITFKKIN